MTHSQKQRGDIAIFIVLIVVSSMVAMSVLLVTILSQQIAAARNVEIVERALYAADAGLEESLYSAIKQSEFAADQSGTIEYENSTVDYIWTGREANNAGQIILCFTSQGQAKGEQRRLALGPPECDN